MTSGTFEKSPGRRARNSERGNVFFTLFGAVAIVGVLGAGIMATMRGPLTTMVNVNRRAQAEADMSIASKLILLEAVETLPNGGDCDLDDMVEPLEFETGSPAPAGGGQIPSNIGSNKLDPWGTPYGYCAWDAGGVVPSDNIADCGGSGANRLAGENNDASLVVAVISAGPNQAFETTCASGPPSVSKTGGSDDFSTTYTYATAVATSGGLWKLRTGDPDVAEIAKDIAAQGATFTGDVDLSTAPSAALRLGAASMFLPTQVEAPDSSCDSSPADDANHGILRINTTTNPDTVEVCDAGTTTWQSVAAGAAGVGLWKNDGPGGVSKIYYNTGNVGIGLDNPAQALDIVGSAKLTDDILLDAGSAITWGATGASISESTKLGLAYGASTVQLTATGIDLTGDTTITGSTADNTKTALEVKDSGGGSLVFVRNDGNVGIGDTTPDDSLSVMGFATVDGAYKIDGNIVLNSDNAMADSILVGRDAGALSTGDFNTVVGGSSAAAMTDATYNVLIGMGVAPSLTEGDFNIIIGAHDSVPVDVPAPTTSNWLNIGNLIYGDLANKRIGIGTSTLNDALEVAGSIDASSNINAGGNIVTATGNITATAGDITAGGTILADTYRIDGVSNPFSTIPDCDDSNDKIIWTAGTGWSCGTDLQGGSGGGAPTLEDVLGEGNDAETLSALNFNQVGAVEFCNEDLSACFDPEDIANGGLDAAISALTDATKDNTTTNAAWNQFWNWQLAGAETGLALGETGPSTGGAGNQFILSAGTQANSTATPFLIDNLGDALSFRVNDDAADSTPFAIDDDGNVGIGTDAPAARLQVVGGNIRVDGDGSGLIGTSVNGTNILAPNNGTDMVAAFGTGGSFMIHDASDDPQILLGSNGRVGIGDMTPDDGTLNSGQLLLLDVAGAAGADYFCDSNGENCFTAASIAGNSLWERNGTVIRTRSPAVYATDDFVFGSGQLDDIVGIGDNNRMYFDKSLSAFRAGTVSGTQWDEANTGAYSVAFGANTTASNTSSTALGYSTTASGNSSTAMGTFSTASGTRSTAIGWATIASGENSLTLGRSVVAGNGTAASGFGDGSMAIGLINDTVTVTTRPQVTGIQSLGIFMGDQDGGLNVSAANIMALLGGRMVIDPNVPATQLNVSTGAQQLELDVEGDIGAINYCDQAGNNCFTASGILTGVTPRLSSITAATANNGINNGAWNQTWNWQLTGAETGFAFSENVASAGGSGDQYILSAGTIANSTATPFLINNLGNAATFRANDEGADATPFIIDDDGLVGIGIDTPTEKLHVSGNAKITGDAILDTGSAFLWDSTTASITEDSGDLDIVNDTSAITLNTAGIALTGDTAITGSTADDTANALELFNSTPTSIFRVQNDGLVGIGDFSSDTIESALHIQSGDIRMDGGAGDEAGCIRFDDTADKLEFSHDCTTFTAMGDGSASAIFERSGTLVRPNASVVTLTTDDFVFGAAQLDNIVGAGDDERMFFDKSKGAFRAGSGNGTQWDDANVGQYSAAMGQNSRASGQYSFATGFNTVASSSISTAMGQSTTASGNSSTAMGNASTASGSASTAMGAASTASGLNSTAMGSSAVASGNYATAMGYTALASGTGSTAMNYQTTASGQNSMAMGLLTTASGITSTAIGRSVIAGDGTAASGFGDGSLAIGLSDNAVTISTRPQVTGIQSLGIFMGDQDGGVILADANTMGLFGGKFVIDPNVPATQLTARGVLDLGAANDALVLPVGDDAARPGSPVGGMLRYNTDYATTDQLEYYDAESADWVALAASGSNPSIFERSGTLVRPNASLVTLATDDFVFGAAQLADIVGTDDDNRMFFDKSKGAFRAGSVSGTEWDDVNVGIYSTALGAYNTASGGSSTALGNSNTADGDYSTALGYSTTAVGISSIAMGDSTVAAGDKSLAAGDSTEANGNNSVALGSSTVAGGSASLAMGNGSEANGSVSTAIGEYAFAEGTNSIALGTAIWVDGAYSMALGLGSATGAAPGVSGNKSLGIFMDDQTAANIADTNTMAVLGGKIVVDPNVPATQFSARGVLDLGAANDALVLPVGDDAERPGSPVGGMLRYNTDYATTDQLEYYDAESADWVALAASGSNPSIFERSGTLVRPNASLVTLATDDFVFGAAQLADIVGTDDDNRMFFDKSKGAFRAGYASGTHWDDVNVGNYSIALGRDNEASGSNSTALGGFLIASGSYSTAFGAFTSATNTASTAMGRFTEANGISSTAIGESTTADGTSSTALGTYTSAVGAASIAMGNSTVASGIGSTTIGTSVVAGNGTAASGFGDGSIAMGLIDDAVTITTRPQVTGIQSLGIFMGDQDGGVVVSAANTMALLGGTMVIDPNVPATQLSARGVLDLGAADDALVLPVGDDAARPGSPVGGMLRYNSDYTTNDKLEYYDAESADWLPLVGGSGGSPALSSILLAAADHTINNGAWNQTWNWQLTGAETGFAFGENAASAGGSANQYILSASTMANSTATPLLVNNFGVAASFIVNDVAADATPFIIDADGNVGIGNPTPSVKLDITGDVEYSGTITDVSDIRLKTNIRPLQQRGSMLEKIGQVKTYSFTMKDDAKNQVEFGVMAQELEKIFPELVRTAPDEMGTKSVNYMGLIAPMIEAGKELEAENKALHAEIDELKAQQAEMKQALSTIGEDIKGLKTHTGYGIGKAQMSLLLMLAALGMLSGLVLARRRADK
jgi:hypothetical protein